MPIYEYDCKQCGIVEAIQKVNADPLSECPACGAANPKKIISHSSFQLKGSGWYKDGYASSNSSGDNSSKSKTETSTKSASKCASSCACC